MNLAIISDIHGNFAALEKVIDSMNREKVDKTICLGDIVGYGAKPNECVELVKSLEIPCLLGNHDASAVGLEDTTYYNEFASIAIRWTTDHLTAQSRKFLLSLKYTHIWEDLLFVHSSPNSPESWHYLFSSYDARVAFRSFQESVCFIGHTHIPIIFTEQDGEGRRLINVGSVGQPRDRDPRACWGLFNTESGEFKWMRVEYPIDLTVKQIVSEDLPKFLADRLFHGY